MKVDLAVQNRKPNRNHNWNVQIAVASSGLVLDNTRTLAAALRLEFEARYGENR